MIQMVGQVLGQDIEIKFIGLCFGEKFYEELLDDVENQIKIYYLKIKKVMVCFNDYQEICLVLEVLCWVFCEGENCLLVV